MACPVQLGCLGSILQSLSLDSTCDRVDLPAMFGAKGIEHAEERVSLVVGDVMQPFPETVQKAGVDTLVMKHFLSAFNDKDAVLILKHCSQVLAPKGKVLLLQVDPYTLFPCGFVLQCCVFEVW